MGEKYPRKQFESLAFLAGRKEKVGNLIGFFVRLQRTFVCSFFKRLQPARRAAGWTIPGSSLKIASCRWRNISPAAEAPTAQPSCSHSPPAMAEDASLLSLASFSWLPSAAASSPLPYLDSRAVARCLPTEPVAPSPSSQHRWGTVTWDMEGRDAEPCRGDWAGSGTGFALPGTAPCALGCPSFQATFQPRWRAP